MTLNNVNIYRASNDDVRIHFYEPQTQNSHNRPLAASDHMVEKPPYWSNPSNLFNFETTGNRVSRFSGSSSHSSELFKMIHFCE